MATIIDAQAKSPPRQRGDRSFTVDSDIAIEPLDKCIAGMASTANGREWPPAGLRYWVVADRDIASGYPSLNWTGVIVNGTTKANQVTRFAVNRW